MGLSKKDNWSSQTKMVSHRQQMDWTTHIDNNNAKKRKRNKKCLCHGLNINQANPWISSGYCRGERNGLVSKSYRSHKRKSDKSSLIKCATHRKKTRFWSAESKIGVRFAKVQIILQSNSPSRGEKKKKKEKVINVGDKSIKSYTMYPYY